MAEELNLQDLETFQRLVNHAARHHDGRLTIYRFMTNWRVGFISPSEREDVEAASEGKTFREAANNALSREADRLRQGLG
jgi:hypothetical protein